MRRRGGEGEQVETGSRSFATGERDQDKRMPDSGNEEEADSESKAVWTANG